MHSELILTYLFRWRTFWNFLDIPEYGHLTKFLVRSPVKYPVPRLERERWRRKTEQGVTWRIRMQVFQAWMIHCSCGLFSRFPSLKRRRRRRWTRGGSRGKRWNVVRGDGICHFSDRDELAMRSRVLNKQRGINSRPFKRNQLSNTFSHNLCQFFRPLLRLLFRLSQREKKRPEKFCQFGMSRNFRNVCQKNVRSWIIIIVIHPKKLRNTKS